MADTTMTTLVLGYDRSEASQRALTVAADLAARLGAHLHVVHVIDLLDYPVDPDRADWEEQGQAVLEEEFERVREDLRKWGGEWTYHLQRNDPVAALTTLAEAVEAVMIIVGAGHAGIGATLQRLLTATHSISRGLLRHNHRPVLVVPLPTTGKRQRGAAR